MKKIIFIASTIIIPLLFSGCINKQQIENDLAADENYVQYLEMDKNGRLDADGYYSETIEEKVIRGNGDILVTFAENRFLDMRYIIPDGTVVADKCFLKAGDTLISEKPENKEASANTYVFDRFEIRSNDGYDVNFAFETDENGDSKLNIPESFRGKSLTILPLGRYRDRSVLCRAVVFDENENEITANGTWGLCDDVYCTSEKKSEITTLTFSGTVGYAVRFGFDSNYYYVVETSDSGSAVGLDSVQFPSVQPSQAAPDYEVKLRKYVSMEFSGAEYIDSISINGSSAELSGSRLTMLKQTSDVDIRLKKGFHISENSSYISSPRSYPDGSKAYTVNIPNTSKLDINIVRDSSESNSKYTGVNVVISIKTERDTIPL